MQSRHKISQGLGLLALLAGASQALAATPVTLSCTVPDGANTVVLSTNTTEWDVDPGTGTFVTATAVTSPNPGWTNPSYPAQWISSSATGASSGAVNKVFRTTLQPDPNVVLGSAQIALEFKVDDVLQSLVLNGTTLGGPYAGGFSSASSVPAVAATLVAGSNVLDLNVADTGAVVWGLNARLTLTYDCRTPVTPVVTPAPVPVDAPWALLGLGGLLAAAAAAAARRRRA
ncbi:hypothetical protein CCO03_02315 [Comamonas serinivorans]|uniref:IPTL-CTERM protein sorting domain-containing protein n=1 Tax=Comamonas serinivorans TaxID=1082851 RepID=A0A1Y0EJ49_9BURK|nr:hypothetical protein [Comamonas serinivorans]ARU03674.1 hypothetical protein CCO03_02315 [Comamonas serinivorans]